VVLDGTYKILRRIGDGGMGEVYEARHARLAGRYAVKVLNTTSSAQPEAVARFRREAQVTTALRHPSIVQIIDFNTTAAGVSYLVMEYLDGANLETIIDQEGAQPLERIVTIARQVASALTEAHRRGIVHRDLKPQNIFLVAPAAGNTDDEPERAKVLDFGISKIRSASRALTETAVVLGTPQYMSPEQAEGKTAEVDAATDQFALAAIVYEMLTGAPAFNGDTLATVVYKVVHTAPEPIATRRPDVPAAVQRVVSRGLSKNKAERFDSVADFSAALREAVDGPAPLRRTSSGPTLPPPTRERPAMAALPAPRAPETETLIGPPAATRAARAAADGSTVTDETATTRRAIKVTTLGRQTGELLRLIRGTRSRGRLAAVSTVALVVMLGLGVRSLRHAPTKTLPPVAVQLGPASAPAPVPAIRPLPPKPAPPPTADFDIASDPPGIPLWIDGQPFPNPATQALTRAHGVLPPGTHTFELAKLGFQTWRRTVEMTPTNPTRFLARLRRDDGTSAGAPVWPPPVPPTSRAAVAPGAKPPGAGPKAPCLLTVGSQPWAELWIDGDNTLRNTPVAGMALPCGSHRLDLRRRDLNIHFTTNITLVPGKLTKQRYHLETLDAKDAR